MGAQATSRTTALQEATVQVMENVPDANAEQLMAAGASVDYIQGFNQPFFMFNTLKKPFDDKRVRQAFYYAVDVDKLISNAMAGHAAKVTSFLPESHENYHKASTVYTYDPETRAVMETIYRPTGAGYCPACEPARQPQAPGCRPPPG